MYIHAVSSYLLVVQMESTDVLLVEGGRMNQCCFFNNVQAIQLKVIDVLVYTYFEKTHKYFEKKPKYKSCLHSTWYLTYVL